MSIITKRVTMTDEDWSDLLAYIEDGVDADKAWQSVIDGLKDAETIAVSTTYSRIEEAQRETDAWLADAVAVGVTPDVSPIVDCLEGYQHEGSYDDPNTCYNCRKPLR